jgi:hypothetical protein
MGVFDGVCKNLRISRVDVISGLCGTIQDMELAHFGKSGFSNRTPFRTGAISLLLTLAVLLPGSPSLATGAPLTNMSIIAGFAFECNVGLRNGEILRPLLIKLHERPSGRVVAVYTVEPTTQVGTYAFSARPGTYFLTTSEKTSLPPAGDIIIRNTMKSIVAVNIGDVCQ